MPLRTTNCALIGLPHHDAPDLLRDLAQNSVKFSSGYSSVYPPIAFVPEPENPADQRAIRVEIPGVALSDGKTRKLGYIPKVRLDSFHPFLTRVNPSRPRISSVVVFQPDADLTSPGHVWNVYVTSDDRDLPGKNVRTPPLQHDFRHQKQVWSNLFGHPSSPRRTKGFNQVQVWI